MSGATNFKTVNLTADNPGNLTSITLPSNAETIAGAAFSGCTNLTSVTLPSTLTSIQYEAFSGCSSLTEIEIPAGVTSLADDTFNGCNALSSVTFAPGSQLTTIDRRVFENCSSLSTITLPSSVNSIGSQAFMSCSGLTEFVIPDGVQTLDGTFVSCSNLASITIPASVNKLQNNPFYELPQDCVLKITSNGGSIIGGSTQYPTRRFKVELSGTSIPLNDSSVSIFKDNNYLTEVKLPNTITTIPANAFNSCMNVTKINIPATVSSIGTDAFKLLGGNLSSTGGCTFTFEGNQNMTSVSIPDNAHKVVLKNGVPKCGGASIFQDDAYLQEVVFKGGQLGVNNTFSGCTQLTTVTFNSYPSDVSSRSNVLPSSVHNIIFEPDTVPMNNVANVGNLFPSTMNYSSLTVTFKNDSSSIRINPDPMNPNPTAFDFDGAENITYKFAVNPNTNMTYDAGTCFIDGKTATAGGTTYTWNSSTKSWQ